MGSTSDTAGKRGEIERRNPKIEATRRELSANGRQPHTRIMSGNIRTYMWSNPLDESVPVYVELIRYYSRPSDWNTTRLLEASDLQHALRGLDQMRVAARKRRLMTKKPPDFGKDEVKAAVMQGVAPECKFYHSGNVAVVTHSNKVDEYDFVLKVDLLCVVAPMVCKRYFLSSQIIDAQDCLLQVGIALDDDYTAKQKKWYGIES
jgi:hypothetical protein